MSTPAAAQNAADIKPAKGKLGIMVPGMGAVATTLIAGVEAVRRGFAKPIGSMTQMGTIRLGKRTENRYKKVNELVPLAGLDDIGCLAHDIVDVAVVEGAIRRGDGVVTSDAGHIRKIAEAAGRTLRIASI